MSIANRKILNTLKYDYSNRKTDQIANKEYKKVKGVQSFDPIDIQLQSALERRGVSKEDIEKEKIAKKSDKIGALKAIKAEESLESQAPLIQKLNMLKTQQELGALTTERQLRELINKPPPVLTLPENLLLPTPSEEAPPLTLEIEEESEGFEPIVDLPSLEEESPPPPNVIPLNENTVVQLGTIDGDAIPDKLALDTRPKLPLEGDPSTMEEEKRRALNIAFDVIRIKHNDKVPNNEKIILPSGKLDKAFGNILVLGAYDNIFQGESANEAIERIQKVKKDQVNKNLGKNEKKYIRAKVFYLNNREEIINRANKMLEKGGDDLIQSTTVTQQTGQGINNNDYIPYGKLFIKRYPLDNNMLSVYKQHGGKMLRVDGLPLHSISDNFKRMILNQKINKNKMKLSQKEKQLLSNLTTKAKTSLTGTKKKYMEKYFLSLNDAEQRLNVLLGEIMAGNDSVLLKNEVHELLKMLEQAGRLTKQRIKTIIKRFQL